jgi:hypothetical protein
MENVFEVVVKKLLEVGFYDLLLFIFSLTLFYAILKKVKILGESPLINAVVAFTIAFLIFGFPVIVGFSLTLPLVTFFTHSFVCILMFFLGFLIASFFYPDLPKFLAEKFTSRSVMWIGIAIGISVAIISGLISVFFATPTGTEGGIKIPMDTVITAAGVIIFVILLIIAGSIATQKAT